MTMNYGLSPAEQAGRRAQQRGLVASSTRRATVPPPAVPPPADFGGTPGYTKPQIARRPITPSVRIAPFAEYTRQSPIGKASPVVQTEMPYIPRGPMTGPNDRRDLFPQFHNYMLSPSWAGGAFEPNIPWDHTQPYPTPSRIGPAVVPPRGFTGQIERGYGGYPQMQQEINPLQVPPRLSNALQTLKKLGMGGPMPMPPTTPPIYSPTHLPPMRQIVEGF